MTSRTSSNRDLETGLLYEKELKNANLNLKQNVYETALLPMGHHPLFLAINKGLFHTAMGREANLAYVLLMISMINSFTYQFSLSMHSYMEYEISKTDYKSQGKLVQLIASLAMLLAFTLLFALQKPCLERKLHGSPQNFYDAKTTSFMLQANAIAGNR